VAWRNGENISAAAKMAWQWRHQQWWHESMAAASKHGGRRHGSIGKMAAKNIGGMAWRQRMA
jgi:hypothetical protein